MLFPVLVFITVSLAVGGFVVWVLPTRTERRLQAIAPSTAKSAWAETAVKIVGPFAQLSSPTGDGETTPLRVRFLNAGIRHPDASLFYLGLKTLLPLGFAGAALAAGFFVVFLPLGFGFALGTGGLPHAGLSGTTGRGRGSYLQAHCRKAPGNRAAHHR